MEQIRKHSRKRDAILAYLRATVAHPSAEDIYRALKPEIPDLSLGTVYRNLAYFVESGEVQVIGTVAGQERFDGDIHPHAHFICKECGTVLDWPQELLKAPEETGRELGVKITDVTLQYSGICGSCLKKEA